MPNVRNPYDRQSGALENRLGLAVALSIGFHVAAAWLVFFVFPHLIFDRAAPTEEFITVKLLGSPAAPTAPSSEVDPNLKKPDVVAATSEGKATSQTDPTVVTDPKKVAIDDSISLNTKGTVNEIKSTEVRKRDPQPTPIRKEIQPSANLDRDIDRLMNTLAAKRETPLTTKVPTTNDQELNDPRMLNIAEDQRRGDGEGSEGGGRTDGLDVHPEKARYYSHVRDLVISNWSLPPNARALNLKAKYLITIEPDGRISLCALQATSGNSDFDLSAERAIGKSSPLPELTPIFGGRAESLILVFDPRDANY